MQNCHDTAMKEVLMNIIVNAAESFMGLFDAGALTFVNWVSTIVPKVLLLLVFMNALIALIGQERINKFAKLCSGNVIMAYGVLPFLSAFMLGNPMALSMRGSFSGSRIFQVFCLHAGCHDRIAPAPWRKRDLAGNAGSGADGAGTVGLHVLKAPEEIWVLSGTG